LSGCALGLGNLWENFGVSINFLGIMSQQPPNPLDKTSSKSPQPLTKVGKRTQIVLRGFWESLDQIGQGLMGDLWRTVYLSIQDAIALGVLLQVPSWLGKIIIGKDFSSFDLCQLESPLGVTRYACYIIITSDFLLWILLASRILGRFIAEGREQWQNMKDKNHGARKP
jgi:hypothetical protein